LRFNPSTIAKRISHYRIVFQQIAPALHTGKRIFNSLAKPKQQQLATPRSWQESAIGRNGEFVRPDFEPSKHLAVGWIDLDHVEFRVQRHSLWMRADVQFTRLAEGHVVKLTAKLPLAKELPLRVKPVEAAVLAVGNIKDSWLLQRLS
jgi:hypothetical protein